MDPSAHCYHHMSWPRFGYSAEILCHCWATQTMLMCSGEAPTKHGIVLSCVCLSPLVGGGYLSYDVSTARLIWPPLACNVMILPDSAHQPLHGDMLADGCPLGRCKRDSNCKPCHMRWFQDCLLASPLARHSVTPRCCLSRPSFLALSDFQGVGQT